jgi:hypothetical protein
MQNAVYTCAMIYVILYKIISERNSDLQLDK